MCRMKIENGITIDAVENVVMAIEHLNGMKIDDYEVIKKFITEENSTKYYIDDKLNSYMEPTGDAVYVWLDSGFVDRAGRTILISLHRSGDGFEGHITATGNMLIKSMKERYRRNLKYINTNASRFMNKLTRKTSERDIHHIDDIQEYYLMSSNRDAGKPEDSDFMKNLMKISEELVYTEDFNETASEAFPKKEEINNEAVININKIEKIDKAASYEDDITVGILMDYIDSLHSEIDRLVGIIEDCKKDKEYIEELHEREKALKSAITGIRVFNEREKEEIEKRELARYDETKIGHNVLAGRKLLILGDSKVTLKDIQGIAKNYGFEKKDIDCQTDYKKITNDAGRLQHADRYAAIILGAVPHKVSKLGKWNSIVEKFATPGYGPVVVESHNLRGELEITKESLKTAINEVLGKLDR